MNLFVLILVISVLIISFTKLCLYLSKKTNNIDKETGEYKGGSAFLLKLPLILLAGLILLSIPLIIVNHDTIFAASGFARMSDEMKTTVSDSVSDNESSQSDSNKSFLDNSDYITTEIVTVNVKCIDKTSYTSGGGGFIFSNPIHTHFKYTFDNGEVITTNASFEKNSYVVGQEYDLKYKYTYTRNSIEDDWKETKRERVD